MWRFVRFLPSLRHPRAWVNFRKYIRWRLALYGFAFPHGRLSWRRILSREFLRAVWEYHRWLGEMDSHKERRFMEKRATARRVRS